MGFVRKGAGYLGVILSGVVALASSLIAGVAVAGQVERGTIASPHLGRGLPYMAYLPDAFETAGRTSGRDAVRQTSRDGGSRFPVLYLLHGLGDDETTWLKAGRIRRTLDRLMAAGEVPAMIVVMPGAGRSWYVDDVRPGERGEGAMFSAFSADFIAGIDQRYPTLACRAGRAIGGLSMGGYGAVLAGVTHPERFRAVISLSGSLFSPDRDDFSSRRVVYGRIFGGVFGEPPDYRRFKAWNVFSRLARLPAGARVPDMFLSAGDDDFRSILSGTVRFHAALRQHGARSQLRVIDGGHDWSNWRGEIGRGLKWLGGRIARACPRETARPGATTRCEATRC